MQWKEIIKTIHTDELIEIPNANDYFKNKAVFNKEGFTVEILDNLFPIIEQQLYSIFSLFKLAKSLRDPENILEIGSGRGGSLSTFGIACPRAKLINIDKFQVYKEDTHSGKGENYFVYDEFLRNLKKLGIIDRVTTVKKWSDEAIEDETIKSKKYDLIFIDGNHGYDYVKRDISNYSKLVKDGGILCGHDFHPRFPGVIKAVEDSLGDDYDVCINSSVWYRK